MMKKAVVLARKKYLKLVKISYFLAIGKFICYTDQAQS